MPTRNELKSLVLRLFRGTSLPTAAELKNYTGSTPATAPAPTSNPWIAAIAATTPILFAAGTGILRVRCELRDGNGQPIQGVLKVYVVEKKALNDFDINDGIGTRLFFGDLSNDGANDVRGGVVSALSTEAGRIDASVTLGAGATTLVLEHLGHHVVSTITLT